MDAFETTDLFELLDVMDWWGTGSRQDHTSEAFSPAVADTSPALD